MAREISVKQKERVQFDFTPEALKRLDELKEKTEASTRAEIVRNALNLYDWLINDVDPDNTIKVIDKNGETTTIVKAKLLRK